MATDTTETTQATEPEQPNEQLAPTPSKGAPVPLQMGMTPRTPEEGWRLAQILGRSELVPKIYRGKPADILVAIQYGIEVGFAPMQALQSICVINGRASVWGDGFLALLMSSPLYRDHDEYYEVKGERRDGLTVEDLKRDDSAAVCTFWRRGKATEVTRRFSVGQARKAGLLGKEGPWATYPDRMMSMRARSWAGRDAFPDLLRGIRTAEEARDLPDDDDTIEVVQPRRASASANSSATPAPSDPPKPELVGGEVRTQNPSVRNGGDSGQSKPPAQEQRGGLLVVNTAFVRPPQGEPFYRIETTEPNGLPQTFTTRDEQLYKEAASFEGSDYRVRVGYHTEPKTATDVGVCYLDSIALDETSTPPTGAGELFR